MLSLSLSELQNSLQVDCYICPSVKQADAELLQLHVYAMEFYSRNTIDYVAVPPLLTRSGRYRSKTRNSAKPSTQRKRH